MPRTKISEFSIDCLRIMDEQGNVDSSLMPKLESRIIIKLFKTMLLARAFDAKLLSLQRQGRIGTFPQAMGQEAVSLGAVACLEKNDWMIPSYREFAGMFYRNHSLAKVILSWAGDERGNIIDMEYPGLPYTMPIAGHLPHAVGIAMGMKLNGEKKVVLTFCGDGATSEGDFHESLNFAGVFKAPAIFIVQNNQYAISTPTRRQTSSETFAQKGVAYGIPSIKVDGNDIFAVYVAVKEAVKRAREGNGPYLIEAFTYRLCDHTSADDSKRYRAEGELQEWKNKDPILRLRKYLEKSNLWSAEKESDYMKEVEEIIEKAVEEAERIPPPTTEDIFQYMYAEMDQSLKEQMEYCKKFQHEVSK